MDNTEDEQPFEAGLDVVLINRAQRMSVLTNGVSVPVTNWFDRMGDECDPQEAVVCVTGTDALGWFVVDLEKFDYVSVH